MSVLSIFLAPAINTRSCSYGLSFCQNCVSKSPSHYANEIEFCICVILRCLKIEIVSLAMWDLAGQSGFWCTLCLAQNLCHYTSLVGDNNTDATQSLNTSKGVIGQLLYHTCVFLQYDTVPSLDTNRHAPLVFSCSPQTAPCTPNHT